MKNTLKDCIYGEDIWKGNIFRIDSERRKNVMNAVLEESEYSTFANKTEENIIARYKDISKYIDELEKQNAKIPNNLNLQVLWWGVDVMMVLS